jgi:hypothetical protein
MTVIFPGRENPPPRKEQGIQLGHAAVAKTLPVDRVSLAGDNVHLYFTPDLSCRDDSRPNPHAS